MAIIGGGEGRQPPFDPRSAEQSRDPQFLRTRIAGLRNDNYLAGEEIRQRMHEINECQQLLEFLEAEERQKADQS